jgi:hypothetical protein
MVVFLEAALRERPLAEPRSRTGRETTHELVIVRRHQTQPDLLVDAVVHARIVEIFESSHAVELVRERPALVRAGRFALATERERERAEQDELRAVHSGLAS